MFLLIDNYDSFTYNLYHFLGELGAEFEVRRNDAITVEEIRALNPQGIVISPGPCDPDKAGICLELVEKLGPTTPTLGGLSGTSGDRTGLWRQGGAGAAADAREGLADDPFRSRRVRGATDAAAGDPLSFHDRRRRRLARCS